MQHSIRHNDDVLAARLGRKFANENGIQLLGGSVIITPSLYAFKELSCELFDLLPPFGQHLYTCAIPRYPNAKRIRLAEHVFQDNFFRMQSGLNCSERCWLIKPT